MDNYTYIQLLFHSASGFPLTLDSPVEETCLDNFSISMFHHPLSSKVTRIPIKAYRLTAFDQFVLSSNYDNNSSFDEENLSIVNVDDIQAFPNGIHFSTSYIICFNMRVPDLNAFRFKIRITLYKETKGKINCINDAMTALVCESYHNGRQMKRDSTGSLTGVLINDNKESMGAISFDYLITSMWAGYNKYLDLGKTLFPSVNRPLMIGHRGSGCSFCNCPSKYLENTMGSFVAAHQSGADFIELDVQLTKDKAVVVFHDFLTEAIFDLDMAKTDFNSRVEIPIRDLSFYQLKKNKFKHASLPNHNDKVHRDTFSDASSDDSSIFPLISEVITNLPPHIGIDIEVKFPQQSKNGSWELEGSYFDRNTVVERVLEEVFESNANHQRPIIFSSFDPGICVMLRRKQKHYPVFFIFSTVPINNYMDVRCHDIRTAVTFAVAEQLHGVCMEIDHILPSIPRVTSIVHSSGLRLITWGNANNSVENITKQTDCKVDGIIFDRIYDLMPATRGI